MRRRALGIGLASALACSAARAQTAAPRRQRRIGALWLRGDSSPNTLATERPLARFLRTRGWMEGENVVTELAFADYRVDRLKGLALRLLGNGAEVIYASGVDAAVAAARATRSVPIVFDSVVWPLEFGLIDAYARPGRNATGVAEFVGPETPLKRLELLRELAPEVRRMVWLLGSSETVAGDRLDWVSLLGPVASTVGFESRFLEVGGPEEIDTALSEALKWRVQVLQAGSPYATLKRQVIGEFCLRHRVPCATAALAALETTGWLFRYGTPATEFERLAVRTFDMVDRILRGVSPAEIPVELPTRTEFVLNMRTARALDIKVKAALRLRADRVIG